jgi:hypothetical protein
MTGVDLIKSNNDSAVGLRISRYSATGRAQYTLEDENLAQLWRCGLTGAGATNFSFYNGTTINLTLERAGNSYFQGGNVGIGITAPTAKLHVVGNADTQQLIVTGHTTQAVATPMVQFTRADAATGISTMLGLTALGSGANGDGGALRCYGKDSTTLAQNMANLEWYWPVVGGGGGATHTSRYSQMDLSVYSVASKQVGIAMRGNSAGVALGFFSAASAPVIQPASANQAAVAAQTQQTLTDSTGGTASTTLALIAGALYATDAPVIANAVASLAARLAEIKSDVTAIKTFQNQQRLDEISLGLIKGSA